MAKAYVEYPLSGVRGNGLVTLIDPDVAETLAGRSVCMSNRYPAMGLRVNGRQTTVKLHRFVLGLANGEPGTVDHINGNALDNRRSNLRVTTQAANLHNKASTRGPYWRSVQALPSGQFYTLLKHEGVSHYLGTFETRREAWWAGESWRRANVPDYLPQHF